MGILSMQVEHELHRRRLGRNVGVGLLLLALVGIVFGLTVVKVIQLGNADAFESFDHVARPQIIPEADQ
jgi:Na+/H+-dicarboxylate symporter